LWYNADMDKHIKKHNGPGVIGRQTRPPMSEEQKLKMVELVNAGFSRKSIAEALNVPYQSVNRELRELGMSVGQGKAKQQIITPEALEQMKAVLTGPRNDLTIQETKLPELAKDDTEAESRTKVLGHEILRGAERLIKSINHMSDEALASATLHHRATALGILVDKLKVINNQAQPMFGATAGNQTMNIINIIASASPPRAKDAKPESRKSLEEDEEQAVIIQPNQLTAKEQLRKEELDEDTFDGF